MVIVLEMTISVHYIENGWYLMCTLLTTLIILPSTQRHSWTFREYKYTKPSDLFRERTSGVMSIADLHSFNHLDSNLSAVVSLASGVM